MLKNIWNAPILKLSLILFFTSPSAIASPAKPVQLAITQNMACAIFDDGTAKCSRNLERSYFISELRVPPSETPTQLTVVSQHRGYRVPYSGTEQACILTDTGRVYCWFQDTCSLYYGPSPLHPPIGDLAPTPVSLPGRAKKIVSFDVNRNMALLEDGRVFLWKTDQSGSSHCMYRTPEILVEEIDVPTWRGPLEDISIGSSELYLHWERDLEWRSMAFGIGHRCAVKKRRQDPAGAIFCEGNNKYGQSNGHLQRVDEESWESIYTSMWTLALRGEFIQTTVAEPAYSSLPYSCALSVLGEIYCWGGNYEPILGQSSPLHKTRWGSPERVELGQPAVLIASGNGRTCAILDDGSTPCWGPWQGRFQVTSDLDIRW